MEIVSVPGTVIRYWYSRTWSST